MTFGPDHYVDEKWDLQLTTLNYKGQEIDIGGAFDTKIFDDLNKTWVHCPADFETAQNHRVFGIQVPVVAPRDLIEYKKLLIGEHQKQDIAAVQQFISKKE